MVAGVHRALRKEISKLETPVWSFITLETIWKVLESHFSEVPHQGEPESHRSG